MYLERCKKGDSEARDILIERNLRLVAHVAKKYHNADEDPDDLISVGTIGLIKAVSTFDSSRASRLSTYAARCIDKPIRSPTRFQMRKKQSEKTEGRFLLCFQIIIP